MTTRSPDRRVRRTRRRLKEALLALIDEQGYEGITIEDITGRADVGRSTFYSHYTSKEDLLFSGFDQWLLSLGETAPGGGDDGPQANDRAVSFRFSLPLLRHIRSQKRFFQATIVRGSDARIREKITALLVELVRREMARMDEVGAMSRAAGRDGAAVRDGQAHAVVGAFLGLTSWWLTGSSRLSAERIDRVFQDLILPDPEAA